MSDHTPFYACKYQIRHQATNKMGSQPSDYKYGILIFLRGLCDTYKLTYSFYHSQEYMIRSFTLRTLLYGN